MSNMTPHKKDFNPRLQEGGDAERSFNDIVLVHFNPRLQEGGDNVDKSSLSLVKLFQSTPPRRKRQVFYRDMGICKDFNPRLQEGGDFSSTYPQQLQV